MSTNVIMPEMGEGVIEGTIARWLKKEGDTVEQYEPILEIETDKVTTEATAEITGTLLKIMVPAGETVEVGTVLAIIGGVDEAVAAPAGIASAPAAAVVSAPPVSKTIGRNNGKPAGIGRITPVVARMAGEHNLDLTLITGTGRNGRITKKDVVAYLKDHPTPSEAPVVAPTAPTPAVKPVAMPAPVAIQPPPVTALAADTLAPLTSMRRAIAEHMVMSKRTSPHVTTVFDVDFGKVMAHYRANKPVLAQGGVRLTLTPYTMMAVASALRSHPLVNSSWTDEGVLQRRAINIGMATAIEAGLIVPVIHSADDLNLTGMAKRVNDLAERARSNRLQPNEVQGGTFTVTNHGVSGSLLATPIINQPQTGILGIGKIEKRVVVVDDMIAIRPMAYVSFSFDHRVLDGASADNFVAQFKHIIENWS